MGRYNAELLIVRAELEGLKEKYEATRRNIEQMPQLDDFPDLRKQQAYRIMSALRSKGVLIEAYIRGLQLEIDEHEEKRDQLIQQQAGL